MPPERLGIDQIEIETTRPGLAFVAPDEELHLGGRSILPLPGLASPRHAGPAPSSDVVPTEKVPSGVIVSVTVEGRIHHCRFAAPPIPDPGDGVHGANLHRVRH